MRIMFAKKRQRADKDNNVEKFRTKIADINNTLSFAAA